MSPISIRLAILSVLREVQPYALPVEQLLRDVNRQVRPALTADQLHDHLSWLLDRMMIDFLPDDLDPANVDARKWLITEAGLAALRK